MAVKGIKPSKSLFVDVDVSISLRALAIISIVTGHFGAANLPGGSGYLFLLSGFNFVLFTMPKIEAANPFGSTRSFMKPFGRYLRKLLVPSALYIGLLFLILQEFHIYSILFLSNFQGPDYAGGLSYWFLDVLAQIFIIFGAFLAFKPTRRYLFANPHTFFLGLFVVAFAVRTVSKLLFDTSDFYDRLPHLYFPIFVLGGLIAYSNSKNRKIVATILLGLTTIPLFIEGSPVATLTLTGGLATLWLETIKIPKLISAGITKIALSSLFIYLCHFHAQGFLSKFVNDPHPALSTVAATLTGILLAFLWKNRWHFKNLGTLKNQSVGEVFFPERVSSSNSS